MSKFDLGLINGNTWTAGHVDAVEAAINQLQIIGFGDTERLALTPSPGQMFFDINTQRQWQHDGIGWVIMSEPWRTYTPTLVGTSLGSGGTVTGRYHRADGICMMTARVTLGSGGSFVSGGEPVIGVPVPLLSGDDGVGSKGLITDVDTGSTYVVAGLVVSANAIVVRYVWPGLNDVKPIISNTPFTAAVGDHFVISMTYQMASRYS